MIATTPHSLLSPALFLRFCMRDCVHNCVQFAFLMCWNKFNSLDDFEQEIFLIYAKRKYDKHIRWQWTARWWRGESEIEQPSTTLINISILFHFICAFFELVIGKQFRGRMRNIWYRCQIRCVRTPHYGK